MVFVAGLENDSNQKFRGTMNYVIGCMCLMRCFIAILKYIYNILHMLSKLKQDINSFLQCHLIKYLGEKMGRKLSKSTASPLVQRTRVQILQVLDSELEAQGFFPLHTVPNTMSLA